MRKRNNISVLDKFIILHEQDFKESFKKDIYYKKYKML